MATAERALSPRTNLVFMWVSVVVNGLNIWVDHNWPDSLASTLAFGLMSACFLTWFGYQIWTGYRRRRPYWTAESWRRYLRMAALPVVVLILFFAEMAVFDSGPNRAIFGEPRSTLRETWIAIDLLMMLFGTVGLVMAIHFLNSGDPSRQFTLRRLFPYRWRNSQLVRED